MPTINLGTPTGPRLRGLTTRQIQLLDDWLTMALVAPPSKWEALPVDYTRALAELAKRRGIQFAFSTHQMRVPAGIAPGKNIPGCVGGSKRTISASPRPKLHGQKIDPWNVRDWRD